MHTLVLSGSPRPHGDSMALVEELCRHLHGKVTFISAYRANISPCTDCRYCWQHPECSIHDEMQAIYGGMNEFDNVVIASPLYMSELTGPLLSVASRLQVYYAARHFRGEKLVHKAKGGLLLLSGGGDGKPDPAVATARIILRHFKADCLAQVMSLHTNEIPAREDAPAMDAAREAALLLNRRHDNT